MCGKTGALAGRPMLSAQVRTGVTAGVRVHCKSVGSAYEGSNPPPATPGQRPPTCGDAGRGPLSSVRLCPTVSGPSRLSTDHSRTDLHLPARSAAA
jgi:hypothetical protein